MSDYIMSDFFKYVLMDNKTNLANFLFENWFNLLESIYLTNMVFAPWPAKEKIFKIRSSPWERKWSGNIFDKAFVLAPSW